MQILILAAYAAVLALVAVGLMFGGSRLYVREGVLSYVGIPIILASVCVGFTASYASLGVGIYLLRMSA